MAIALLIGLLVDVIDPMRALVTGILLLVVFGVILVVMFIFAGLLVIDREVGPIEALKESYRITSGHRWSILGLILVLFLINLLGLLALIVGMLVSIPIALLALTHAYRVLSGSAEARPADAVPAANLQV